MSEKLKEARGKIEERRQKLHSIFEQAGDEYDMDKVTLLEGDSAGKVEQIRGLNSELDDLHAEMKELEGLEAIKSRMQALGQVEPHPGHAHSESRGMQARARQSLGEMFVQSRAFKGYERGSMSAGPIAHFDIPMYSVLFETAAGWAPESTRIGRVELIPKRPAPHVVDFIPAFPTGQAVVKHMLETTHTDNAAEVTEGLVYGESAFVLTEQSETVRKVGVWLPVTDEQLDDEEDARAYVDGRLSYQLARRLDAQVLVGTGTAPNLKGTENVTGIQTQALGTDPIFDAVFKLFRKIRDDGFAEPSVGFIAPSKWETVRLTRTADGLYIMGNPSEPGPDTLWGIPIVQTTAVTATKLVAGDYTNFSGLYERRGIDIQVGFQSDDFIKGRLAIRADVRVAMVHFRVKAFGTVTGL